MRIAIQEIPFTFEQTSRQRIRDWVAQMERMVHLDGPKKGQRRLSARSIEIRCGYFQAIVETSIKSGFLPDDAVNIWRQVDFAAGEAAGDNHIRTATEEDYRGIGELLRTTDVKRRIRLVILLQAYCGTRVSEIVRRQPEDWNLDASPEYGTVTIPLHKGKNRTSARTVLIPPFLVKELKAYGFQGWPTGGGVNVSTKKVDESLTTHSFRHGIVRLNRDLGGDLLRMESYVGHKVRQSAMFEVYGSGFDPDSFLPVLTPIWQQLDEWIKP